VKGKVVLGVLATTGILALSATMAQAGAGGIPSVLTSFFVCHEIHGTDPGQVLDVESPFFGPVDSQQNPILQRIKTGKAALACAFARLFPPGSPEPIEPGEGLQLKCYQITSPQNAKVKPPTQYQAFDALVGEEMVSVPASKLQYLCAPSSFFPQ
jgi:hypothetical protein